MEIRKIKFDEIDIGSYSPRIPKSLQGGDMESLVPYFIFNEDLNPLVGSMSVLGWFPTEFLIVQEMYDGRYTIIDGNRRLVACWLILNTDNPVCPDFIKKEVEEMSDKDIDRLRELTVMVEEK